MTARRNKLPTTADELPAAEDLLVRDLHLDPHNPRLAGLDLSVDQQDEITRVLWQEQAVNELIDSIATNGYWRYEELFASRESGRLIVIEGNRRLAAVKLLTDSGLRNRLGITGLPALGTADTVKLQRLPVIECSRQDMWQYIGFQHVNGPQEWDSIAKAQYIARVHNEYGISIEKIASTIGDRHDTVRRLYRGLMVLEQAERTGVFDREDRWNTRFAYSHLWTGLGYSNIQSFLGLKAEKGFEPNPVPKGQLQNLGDICLWLYGSKKSNKRPLIRSQNPDLRILDEALGSRNGVAALRAGLPLETSLKASQGDARLLREAIVVADQKLKEARGLVPTGFNGATDLLGKATAIQTIATSILEDMNQMAAAVSDLGKSRLSARRKS